MRSGLTLVVLVFIGLSTQAWAATQEALTKWPLPPIPPGAVVYPDLPYVTHGSSSQMLDLYLPKEGRNLPLIIYVHGGAFCMGDKRQWIKYQLAYLDQGYAVAAINYRLSSEAIFPGQIEDCKAAVRWLRAHAATYRLDPNHFVAWGASAGGHLAAMLGTTGNIRDFDVGENLTFSSQVEAVADFFGPSDLTRLRPCFMEAGFGGIEVHRLHDQRQYRESAKGEPDHLRDEQMPALPSRPW